MAAKSHFCEDRGALLLRGQFAVEPGHVHIEQLAPVFRRLLALCAPRRLQTGIGESRLQRLFRPGRHLRQRRVDPERRKCRGDAGQRAPRNCLRLVMAVPLRLWLS
jgi:hypothetical protein